MLFETVGRTPSDITCDECWRFPSPKIETEILAVASEFIREYLLSSTRLRGTPAYKESCRYGRGNEEMREFAGLDEMLTSNI